MGVCGIPLSSAENNMMLDNGLLQNLTDIPQANKQYVFSSLFCRSGWTTSQNKLFNRVYKVLISSRLARLANSGSEGEPIQRRLYADKCAKRIRSIFSGVFWVSLTKELVPLTPWLD